LGSDEIGLSRISVVNALRGKQIGLEGEKFLEKENTMMSGMVDGRAHGPVQDERGARDERGTENIVSGGAKPAKECRSGSLAGVDLVRNPAGVCANVERKGGDYDARRLRSQREIIRDVMVSAADCGTWLTLGELRALTRYGEASISAQLRHLRRAENGGYGITKRHREGASPERPGTDGRGDCVWEYRLTRGVCTERAACEAEMATMGG